jgi:hypothetical protein
MEHDPLQDARQALAAGQLAEAVVSAWTAVRPAVLAQDAHVIREARDLAEEIATRTTGATRIDAEQLAAYCAACIVEPRETIPSSWSMKSLFRRSTTKKCPDCAESIQSEALVCRFCGYRYPGPST